MRKLVVIISIVAIIALPIVAKGFGWFGVFGDPSQPPIADPGWGVGEHHLLIDGASHYLLIDGATHELKIDGVT